MQKLYWKGICHDERIKAIREITAIVDKHGTILNFQKFSDVILSLVIEIEPKKLSLLYKCLGEIMLIEGLDKKTSEFSGGTILFLQVTFAQSTGDLEIEVPNIPK